MRNLILLLILPPAGPLLLIPLAAAWRRARLALMWISAAAVWILSSEAFTAPLTRAWSRSAPASVTLTQAQAWSGQPDAVVLVLGGGLRVGAGPEGNYAPKLETLERLQRGVWWARRLQLPLAFTGGRSPAAAPDQPSEAAAVRQHLAEHGDTTLAWAEEQSINTRENARLSAPLLAQAGVRKVILVTHEQHMKRSLRNFRQASPAIEFLPAPLTQAPQPGWNAQDFMPSFQGIRQGRYLVYEWLAYGMGH
ncbi:uncharacterized SAM-binding protein YcdF (DUF218 family) [Inhella inkyongensis]|uniref:Uncharacterized SAM-binding protein YcdF (DUF218 family) n=1 Tax=Inhella inkyongensis TaxID=392593 RepID=A0A840S6W0_9BURK|nr:YdcF family protein [Inhella inkyongensis]MBB5204199.1 uncharacterized SAM-binding protein YcdF (DUF218 family) [Inhella inkyongensis]